MKFELRRMVAGVENMCSAYKCAAMRLLADEEGATLVEYALMLGLIVVVCAAIVGVVGGKVGNLYNSVKPGFPD